MDLGSQYDKFLSDYVVSAIDTVFEIIQSDTSALLCEQRKAPHPRRFKHIYSTITLNMTVLVNELYGQQFGILFTVLSVN